MTNLNYSGKILNLSKKAIQAIMNGTLKTVVQNIIVEAAPVPIPDEAVIK